MLQRSRARNHAVAGTITRCVMLYVSTQFIAPSMGAEDIASQPSALPSNTKAAFIPAPKTTWKTAQKIQPISLGRKFRDQTIAGTARRTPTPARPIVTMKNADHTDPPQKPDEGDGGHHWLLMRHGQTNHNAEGRIQGSTDVSRLSEAGEEQARRAGEFVAGLKIDKVYVSPLSRARETLRLVETAGSQPLGEPKVVDDLREVDLHEWEGMLKDDVKAKYPEIYQQWRGNKPKDFQLASGKYPIRDLFARARSVWTSLLEDASEDLEEAEKLQVVSKGPVQTLVTAHNGINQALLCSAAGMDEDCFRQYEFPNCGIAEIVWNPGEARARKWRWLYPEQSAWFAVTDTEECNEMEGAAEQLAGAKAGGGATRRQPAIARETSDLGL
mmetsp:Transcript_57757/g.118189  ORF Transcript_57757/g.118189 Transcript_57757/m.118189 type:complete len:385 (+) Transcript_57757:166-1320(+)